MNKNLNENKRNALLDEIRRFVIEFGRVPSQKDFEKLEGYPSRKTFANNFGNFNEAIRLAGFEPTSLSMNEKSERFKERAKKETIAKWVLDFVYEYKKVPTREELGKELGFCLKDCIKESYGTWNNCLIELGLQLNSVSQYTDEFLEAEFHRFVEINGRIPTYIEFNNTEYPSFWCYQNRFGSWTETVRHYGYKAFYDDYNFENIRDNLLKLCNEIYSKENRKIISVEDIEKCSYLPRYCCCSKHLNKDNHTMRNILKENGFEFCENGVGMTYIFSDNERTTSSYEYYFSRLLRNNSYIYNINYFRDVKYKTFINDYHKNMNCDYVIYKDNRIIYIEIAGFLGNYQNFYYDNKIINSSKRKEEYRQKLMQKEKMLKENNLEYYILFPTDLKKGEDFILSIFNK